MIYGNYCECKSNPRKHSLLYGGLLKHQPFLYSVSEGRRSPVPMGPVPGTTILIIPRSVSGIVIIVVFSLTLFYCDDVDIGS